VIFERHLKSDTANDADPNVTPPAASRIFQLSAYVDQLQRFPTTALEYYARVLDGASAAIGAGTVDIQVYAKDEGSVAGASGIWFPIGAAVTALAKDTLTRVAITAKYAGHKLFFRITNVTGTGKTSVALGVAPTT
jgi:hypothetical protein